MSRRPFPQEEGFLLIMFSIVLLLSIAATVTKGIPILAGVALILFLLLGYALYRSGKIETKLFQL